MALKDLTTPTMVAVSSAWIDADGTRPLLLDLLRAGALLPTLERAHADLLGTQRAPARGPHAEELAAMHDALADVDATHDRKARGLYNALTAFADLADAPEDATLCLAVRDKIFPDGIKVIQWSYSEEAEEVAALEERLDDGDRGLLAQLLYPGGTLLDAHQARVEAGRQLGLLEGARTELESRTAGGDKASRADVLRARNGWIRAVNAMLGVLELDEVPGPTLEKLLGPLQDAEDKAQRRAGATALPATE